MGMVKKSRVMMRFVGCHGTNRAWVSCLHPRSLSTTWFFLPPGRDFGKKMGGYQEEKCLNPLSPLSLTARVPIMLFFTNHNNIVIQLGSTRWSE